MAGVNLILFTKLSTHIQFHYIASTCTGGSLISWPAEVFLQALGKKTRAFIEEQWIQNPPVTGTFVSHWLISSKTTKSWFSQSEETYFAFTRQHHPSIAVKVITYTSLKHNINKLIFKYNFPNMLQRLQKISLMYASLHTACSVMPKGTMVNKIQNCKIYILFPICHNNLEIFTLMKKKRYKTFIYILPLKAEKLSYKPYSDKLRISQTKIRSKLIQNF